MSVIPHVENLRAGHPATGVPTAMNLVEELLRKGYRRAAAYVKNAKDRLFSYVRFWERSGLVSPRVSLMIERMMREIDRRLKKIAFGWREEGAAKMARIIIKRITSANE